MRQIFDGILHEEFSLSVDECGIADGAYVYLDDGIFSGSRVLHDITTWIKGVKQQEIELRIVVTALHSGGQYYASKTLDKLFKESKKTVKISWWRIYEIENRKYYKDSSDVLWPTALPDDTLMENYRHYLEDEPPCYPISLRSPGSVGNNKFFSSDEARILLEQQLLIAGLKIRSDCQRLPEVARPLGFLGLKTPGFGSTVVTYRNCSNNCPLAFWAGDPWYPLFRRKTNTDTQFERMIEDYDKEQKARRKSI